MHYPGVAFWSVEHQGSAPLLLRGEWETQEKLRRSRRDTRKPQETQRRSRRDTREADEKHRRSRGYIQKPQEKQTRSRGDEIKGTNEQPK